MSRFAPPNLHSACRAAARLIAAVAALVFAMGAAQARGVTNAPRMPSQAPLASLPIVPAQPGTGHILGDIAGKRATVLLFVSTTCPITNQYAPEIAALVKTYQSRGVAFVRVYSDPMTDAASAARHGKAFGLENIPALLDPHQQLADRLGATVTPDAFVLDNGRTVRYSGRIDDRFVDRGKARTTGAHSHDLQSALDALLANKSVAIARTRAVGCVIEHGGALAAVSSAVSSAVPSIAPSGPTYAHDVAAILQTRCESCHRSGEIGPMPLATYADAKRWATNIAAVTATRQMPPWKPVPGCGAFVGERRLTDAQIATIKAWADAGAPAGDLREAPTPPSFPQGWTLGKPDLILTMPTTWHTPANADEIYRCFVLPTNLTADKQIAAVEFRPGNRSVVHHILAYVDTGGRGRARDGKDGHPGYTSFGGPGFAPNGEMGGWAPGNIPQFLPDGIARALPAKSDIVMQVHYHPTGKPEDDRSQIGLYFTKKHAEKRLRVIPLFADLDIPAGDAHYTTGTKFTVPIDAEVIAVTPHMHLLGRSMAIQVKLPDGTIEPLIRIDDWDFNWQGTYFYQKPIHVPKGSIVTLTATYDNSTANPRNPHSPPQAVHWGEKTTDEMCIGFVSYVADDETNPALRVIDAIFDGDDQ